MLLSASDYRLLPGRFLPHRKRRSGIAHGVCGDDGHVFGVFPPAGKRPFDAAPGVRFSGAEAGRPVVFVCGAVGRGS